MKYTELKNSIKNEVKGIYLLEGDDAYFRLGGEKMLTGLVEFPELNVTSFTGDDIKGDQAYEDFVDALKVFPFMSEKRVVKVSEFYPTEAEYKKYLKGVFENFPDTTILVITNTGEKKSGLAKKKEVTFVDCSKSDRETVVKWIYLTMKRAGSPADVSVCGQIADYCMCDMSRVSVECDKLQMYKPGEKITAEDVDSLVYKDTEYRMYELTNAMAAGNYTEFCSIAQDLMSKGTDELGIINTINTFFKNLMTAVSSGGSNEDIAAAMSSKFPVKPYAVKRMKEQAKAYGVPRLYELERCSYACISDIKSGLVTPPSALQNLCNRIFFGKDTGRG
ncbi:MAG: DNA polymerase III subunit delta [Clostridia bacterium]|nr:DNA polymerase III subunit delta [Clostridia bacterium]